MTDVAGSSGDDAQLQQLLVSWYESEERGERPDLDALCAAAPHLRQRLARLVQREFELTGALKDVRRMTSSEDATGGVPATLGAYTLLAPLGAGGMGRVWIAREEPGGRIAAVKVLAAERMRDPAVRMRFRREVEYTAALDHPNIVPVYGTGEEHGVVWLAMKLLAGPGLDRLESPLPPEEVAAVGARVARALHAAHELGVVHRDVKPANIILDSGIPYVVDFGLARSVSDLTLTQEGAVPGTLPYMAPEQIGGTVALDPRVDVYGLGATLYELLAGHPPFDDERPESLLRSIVVQDAPPLGLRGALAGLEVIVRRALEKDPRRRFASAAEMAEDLERWGRGEAIRSRRPSAVRRWTRVALRHRVASLLLVLVVASLATIGTMLWSADRRRRQGFERELHEATSLLGAGDWLRAREIALGLESEHGRTGDTTSVLVRSEALEELEAILDLIQSPREFQDPSVLAAAARKLGDPEGALAAEPVTRLALASARYYLRDPVGARAALDDASARLSHPLTAAALTALLDGSDPGTTVEPAVSRETQRSSAEDHVFRALALRAAGRPPAEQRRDLEAALDADFGNYRARYGLAVVLHDDGDFEGARNTLLGLREHASHRPLVLTAVARMELLLGKVEAAERALRRADEEIARAGPHAPWLPRAIVGLEFLHRAGRTDAFDQALATARAQWPSHPAVNLIRGASAAWSGRPSEARSIFESLISYEQWPWVRREAELALLRLDWSELRFATSVDPVHDLTDDEREVVESCARRALVLSKESLAAGDRAFAGEALVSRSWALRALGRRGAAWTTLRDAADLGDGGGSADLRFAIEVSERLRKVRSFEREAGSAAEARATARREADGADEDIAGRAEGLAGEALRRARRVSMRAGGGPIAMSGDEVLAALKCEASLASALVDRAGCADACRRALELLEKLGRGGSEEAAALENLRAWALSR